MMFSMYQGNFVMPMTPIGNARIMKCVSDLGTPANVIFNWASNDWVRYWKDF